MNTLTSNIFFGGLSALAFADLLRMVPFLHHEHLLPYSGHLLGTCEFPQYLHFIRVSLLVDFALSNVLLFCSCLFTAFNYLLSFLASMGILCPLCDPTLLVQTYTYSLVILLTFLTAANYLISIIIFDHSYYQ